MESNPAIREELKQKVPRKYYLELLTSGIGIDITQEKLNVEAVDRSIKLCPIAY